MNPSKKENGDGNKERCEAITSGRVKVIDKGNIIFAEHSSAFRQLYQEQFFGSCEPGGAVKIFPGKGLGVGSFRE